MPLRSVEAASREDAIAAAREQFGPRARIIGVRRVRSGGVLGFFATERYVAEVEPDVRIRSSAQPAAERRDTGRTGSLAERAAELAAFLQAADEPALPHSDHRVDEIADLLSGAAAEPAAATYSRSSLGRPTAPVAEPVPTASFAEALAAASSGRTSSPPVPSAADTPQSAPAPDALQRVSFARTSRKTAPVEPAPLAVLRDEPAAESLTPSPFTAALARMVAGDGVVRQAVQDALDEQLARETGRDAGLWDTNPEPVGATETTTGAQHHSNGAEHQEEKPVSELETTSGASPTGQPYPTWAEQPSAAIASREEAIAQILRTALAQNHSDEALADLLRKVLADGSTEPEPGAVVEEPATWAASAAEPAWVAPAPTVAEDVAPAVGPTPAAAPAVAELPVVAELPAAPAPEGAASAEALLADVVADEPIWAAVVLHEAAPAEPVPATPAPTVASLADAIRAQIIGDAAGAPVATPQAAPAVAENSQPVAPPVTAVVEEIVPVQVAASAATEARTENDAVQYEEAVDDSASEGEQTAAPAEETVAEVAEVALPQLARTASDPAPLPSDATTIMPPLSLLPPLPNRRAGGRPPVPPPSRPTVGAAEEQQTGARGEQSLATVTRLPFPPVEAESVEAEPVEAEPVEAEPVEAESAEFGLDDLALVEAEPAPSDELAEFPALTADPVPAPEPAVLPELTLSVPVVPPPVRQYDTWTPLREPLRPEPAQAREVAPASPAIAEADAEAIVGRLAAMGIPQSLLGTDFPAQAETRGTYAALTAALAARLPEAPVVPTGAGEVLFVIGPGVATLRAGRSIAASLGLHPDCVQWASRGELAGLAPEKCRMSTIDTAIDRRSEAAGAGTVTIVAVDAPLRTDAYWMAQMLAVWTPVAVWAVVEATRKPEDLGPWLESLPRVDALILQDTDLSVDPAAVLERVSAPVALLDGVRATPHRWASLLCERLETDRT